MANSNNNCVCACVCKFCILIYKNCINNYCIVWIAGTSSLLAAVRAHQNLSNQQLTEKPTESTNNKRDSLSSSMLLLQSQVREILYL